ncbi:MAG: imidazolonepropionase [Chlamydiales bacterium]|nr:imidazolonepropionase [Chlamydiales bacterium]NCF70438.1 imidazolonepropionase [Chlamydiales bacterium]
MPVLKNISKLYTCDKNQSLIENAALAWENDSICYVGRESELPDNLKSINSFDAQKAIVTPGFIDCHTHLSFGGWREDEFALRNQGASYLELAKAGGGILSTVEKTRKATKQDLIDKSLLFLDQMLRQGVCVCEAKSGYGLNYTDEIKTLESYQELNKLHEIDIIPTCLAAHTFPKEFKQDHEGYLNLLTKELFPEVKKRNLAKFIDIFVEDSAFNIEEAKIVLQKAKELGFSIKLHADQLSSCKGAELGANFQACSCDHLEQISDNGIEALKKEKVVAVSLPLASLYLNQDFLNARKLIEKGVSVAIASDFNPGSSPSFNLQLAMTLAAIKQQMSPLECLEGVCINAAKALKIEKRYGSLEKGKIASFSLFNAPNINHLVYHFSDNRCIGLFHKGKHLF